MRRVGKRSQDPLPTLRFLIFKMRSSMYKKIFYSILILFFLSSHSLAETLIIEPDAGRAPFLNAIKHATSSINLVMYGFTDQTFIDALTRAKKEGKNVTILLEPNPYKAENENQHALHQLSKENITLEWPDQSFKLVHQKTFIFDGKNAIVMTFNLTHGSFNRERNFALTVTNSSEVQEIKKVFDADSAHEDVSVSEPDLVWSPNNSRKKILDFIQSAQSEIKIYAEDVSDYKIIGALAKAARQGVDVKILVSASPEKLRNGKFSFLKKSGVKIHDNHHYYIHAKVIIVDHKQAIVGSINLTKPSLEDNRELSVITRNAGVIHQLDNTFNNDW